MCDGLCDQVNSPTCLVPQLAKHSSIGSIKRDPMPLFQRSGSTVNGPKKPTLPQLVAKLEPTSLPSTSAPKAASGAANQRPHVTGIAHERHRVREPEEGAESEAHDAIGLREVALSQWANRDVRLYFGHRYPPSLHYMQQTAYDSL